MPSSSEYFFFTRLLIINHSYHLTGKLHNYHGHFLGASPQNQCHSVNLSTIKHVTGNFSRSNILGEGTYGVVYKVSPFCDMLRMSTHMGVTWGEET
jgi:hypothetical protein